MPVDPFRERLIQLLEQQQYTHEPVVQNALSRIGWGPRDDTRLLRACGLRPEARTKRSPELRYRSQVTYAMAELLCRALDLDPIDVGI